MVPMVVMERLVVMEQHDERRTEAPEVERHVQPGARRVAVLLRLLRDRPRRPAGRAAPGSARRLELATRGAGRSIC